MLCSCGADASEVLCNFAVQIVVTDLEWCREFKSSVGFYVSRSLPCKNTSESLSLSHR